MKILMATGGSGGHIFPALVTAGELKKRGHTIVFAGALGQSIAKLSAEGYDCHPIKAKGFPSDSPVAVVSFSWVTFASLAESLGLISRIKPNIVVGFGGYGSFSLVLAAYLRGIATVLQEQNVVPGKANRVLACFAQKIAVGFESAKIHFSSPKVFVSGCPSRIPELNPDRQILRKIFGLPEDLPVLLVAGGSQGSHRINSEIMMILDNLKKKIAFGAIHICGDKDVLQVQAAYECAGIPHAVYAFTNLIDKAYVLADLVISRAGAMTVTELAAYRRPAILIPYPHAGGHQRDNALVLSQTGASRMIEEKDLNTYTLEKAILEMLQSRMPEAEIARRYAGIYRPDAAKRLADIIEETGS